MKSSAFPIMLVLFMLMGLGLSVLIWWAPISASELTDGQRNLLGLADGMVKVTLGAILGFMGVIFTLSNRDQPPPS